LLGILAFCSEILPIVFYLSFYKRNRGEGLWVIFVYCTASLLSEPAFTYLGVNSSYIYSGFTIVEFTLFSLFFYLSFQEKKFKYSTVFGALIFYAISIPTLTGKKDSSFDSLNASLEAVLIILYCILFLYEKIRDPKVIFVYYTKQFWIIVAFFIYFSSTLFLFLYAGSFTVQQHKNYWVINNFFEILKNILFSIAFIMKKNIQRSYLTDNLDPDI
jgi:hypothetical protein